MQKKIIVLAVTSCLTAPMAMANTTSNITVYGRMNTDIESIETSGATVGAPVGGATQVAPAAYRGVNQRSTARMTSNSSNFGFRGNEDLGNGLKAWFQIESGLNVDTGTGSFGSRNTAVGLNGGWGNVLVGQWDTPYKSFTIPFGFFKGITNVDYANLMGNAGFGTPVTTTRALPDGAGADASFDRRQGNSIQYWSPVIAGFSARLGYSLPENKADGRVPQVSSDILSLSVGYKIGGFNLFYGYEQHNDYFGLKTLGGTAASLANRSSKDHGHKIAAFYTVGDTTVRGVVERLDFKNSDSGVGNVNQYRRDAFFISVEQKIGASNVWASYGKANSGECAVTGGAVCNTDGLGAQQWALGYKYNMSKRTFLYSYYGRVQNERSARYGIAYPLSATSPGATTTAFAVGINHDF